MTKRAPSMPTTMPTTLPQNCQWPTRTIPATAPAPTQTCPASPPAPRTKDFILADLDGRNPWRNRACAACIARLAPAEADQVHWHPTCRLCDVAACKPEAFTEPFCDFLHENPTVFHAVDYFTRKLTQAGFEEVCVCALPQRFWICRPPGIGAR